MADLDALYARWWVSDTVEEQRVSRAALFDGVLRHARRALRDDDAASDVVVVVLEKIDRFVRAAEDSFTHWVNAIIRRTRVAGFKAAATQSERQADIDPDALPPSDESFVNLSELPDDIKQVAELIVEGHSLKDVALKLGKTPNALRQKLWRYRVTKHAAQSINR